MIQVVIADDHELIRDGFRKLLSKERDIELVGEAADGAELLYLLEKTSHDVIILDISLPDMNGIEVLKNLKQSYPDSRVLILSMHPEERYAQRVLKSGAAGYISKASVSDELIRAIRKVHGGGRYISEKTAEQIADGIGRQKTEKPHERLSDREFEIFLHIGEGKSIHEITELLNLSINTVNTYRRRLLNKMGLHSNTEIVQYIYRHKLID